MTYTCNKCSQSSRRKYNISKHIVRKHKGIGRPIKSVQPIYLNNIDKAKNFKCPYCSQRSKRPYNITVHVRRTHPKILDQRPDFDFKSNSFFTKRHYFNFPPDFNNFSFKDTPKQKSGFTRFLNFYCTAMLYLSMMSRLERRFNPNFLVLNTSCFKQMEPLAQNLTSTDKKPVIRLDKLFENLQPEIEKLISLLDHPKNTDLDLKSNIKNPVFEINTSNNCNYSIENKYEDNKIQDLNEISLAKEVARKIKNELIDIAEKRVSPR